MALQRAFSTRDRVSDVVAEFRSQLSSASPKLLLFFASPRHPLEELGGALEKALGVAAVGCTTAGEIVSGHMLEGAVVGMLFDASDLADLHVEVITEAHDMKQVRRALQACGEHFGQRVREMAPDRYVGLVLMDGLAGAEEKTMATLGAATNVAFVGGSAADDMAFEETRVYARGRSWTGGAVLLLLEPVRGFSILKTQSVRPLPRKLVATSVDEPTRTVHEFDGRPASTAYAEALGVSPVELPGRMLNHPLGLFVNDEPFVRSPRAIAGTSVSFFCHIVEGMELAVLESGDIVADTSRALADRLAPMGGASGIVNFHCVHRTQELKQQGRCDAYGRVFADVPTVGFSTYGEAYVGHMNQTATMLLFK